LFGYRFGILPTQFQVLGQIRFSASAQSHPASKKSEGFRFPKAFTILPGFFDLPKPRWKPPKI
jgi:hypothetical protein